MKTVTTAWLRKHEACEEQVEIFQKEWGNKAYITRENLQRARRLGMDIGWLIWEVLNPRDMNKLLDGPWLNAGTSVKSLCENNALLAQVK